MSDASDVGRLMPALGREGEDFDTILGDTHGMFELCGERAVARHGCPAVAEYFNAIATQIDHGLNGEEHAGPEIDAMSGLAVMHDVGQGMKYLAKAVAAEIA